MLAVCLRYTKNKQEAEDALQESFIKIFMNIHKFRNEGAIEAWIRRITVNTALASLRKKIRLYTFDDGMEAESDFDSELILSNLAANDLLEIIQTLPEGYRTVLNLYIFEQYSHKQISDMLGIAVGTSKSQLAKARTLLKVKISKKNKYKINVG
ncbi:MAG: sigma-70 family RNA polymerase sigma factor [Bacteroidetes bacterium]|nr:sigma-70 family RNA polymerase sigma factor [Bacteroidota bacterium]